MESKNSPKKEDVEISKNSKRNFVEEWVTNSNSTNDIVRKWREIVNKRLNEIQF